MSENTELDAARSETVSDIAGCLCRLSRANTFLTLAQRVALADIARDLADAFDEGRTLTPERGCRGGTSSRPITWTRTDDLCLGRSIGSVLAFLLIRTRTQARPIGGWQNDAYPHLGGGTSMFRP